MDENLPLLLRPVEAAKLLSISRSRCYELIAGGVVPSVRIGASVRVPRVALLRWIERQTNDPSISLAEPTPGRGVRR